MLNPEVMSAISSKIQVETGLAVELFSAPVELLSPAETARVLGEMSDQERARYERIRHEPTRQCYLVTRRLVRRTLGALGGVEPGSLRFSYNEKERPYLTPEDVPSQLQGLDFNIAHSRELVVLATAWGGQVGVDLEPSDRKLDHDLVAERFFSDVEIADLAELKGEERARRFLKLWVLKEAWLKADGRGLSAGLHRVIFRFDMARRPRLVAVPDDDVERWQVELHEVGGHFLAVALAAHA